MEDIVKRASMNVLIKTLTADKFEYACEEDQKEVYLMLADATRNPFQGSMETVEPLFSLLGTLWSVYKRIPVSWYVEVVLKIHSSIYASISETGGEQLDSYWGNDMPIPYYEILRELMVIQNKKWNSCFEESFRTQAGLQFLLQHLQYLDNLTQTSVDTVPDTAYRVLEFIAFMGWRWDWTKDFVATNLFMETLYSITSMIFELNINLINQYQCLLAWFGLFGKNTTCLDCNGVSWSIQWLETEMIQFLETLDSDGTTKPCVIECNWEEKALLEEFIETSGSDQESVAVRTAAHILKSITDPLLQNTITLATRGLQPPFNHIFRSTDQSEPPIVVAPPPQGCSELETSVVFLMLNLLRTGNNNSSTKTLSSGQANTSAEAFSGYRTIFLQQLVNLMVRFPSAPK